MSETPPEPSGEPERIQSISEMRSTLDRILDILQMRGSETPAAKPEDTSGRGVIGEEIRKALDERDAKAKAEAKPEPKPAKEDVKEKNPEPLPRRIENFMGWR